MEHIMMLYHLIIELILIYPAIAAVLIGLPAVALIVALLGGQKNWSAAKKPALVFALIAGLVAFFGLPTLFKSSLSEISYYVDWLFHLGYVVAVMVYVYLVVWFLSAPFSGQRQVLN